MAFGKNLATVELDAMRAESEALHSREPPHRAVRRLRPFCIACMSRVCDHFAAPPPSLTPRQVSLIRLMAGGPSNKELAEKLDLDEGTIKVYISRIFDRLGLSSRLELALWSIKHAAELGPEG